ncbi:hypothetical protein [Sphingobium limneticum]|uniref:hypothetical protein n=1 Tax=Sphingobium limneticum TaxID=1007511 RepID=UPI001B8822AB|nr:hypothetical protein [Sphingobium limneticum]
MARIPCRPLYRVDRLKLPVQPLSLDGLANFGNSIFGLWQLDANKGALLAHDSFSP